MKTIVVNSNDSGQRIDKFLSKYLTDMPQALIYKYIRKKRVKINHKRCEVSKKISEGDIIELYINDEFFNEPDEKYDFLNAPSALNIIYEDRNIILVDKRVGLIVHPDESTHTDCLINRIKKYLYNKGEFIPQNENSFSPSLVNRIDRNTSGIVIACKNSESLRILNEKMKSREIEKYYICIVHGRPPKKSDTLKAFLQKNEDQNTVYISEVQSPGYKPIETKYKVIRSNGTFSMLEIQLLTGRTHQIRAHLAFLGYPILGDGKYGLNLMNKETGYKHQALCSYKLIFKFSSDAGILNYLNHMKFTSGDIWFIKRNPEFLELAEVT